VYYVVGISPWFCIFLPLLYNSALLRNKLILTAEAWLLATWLQDQNSEAEMEMGQWVMGQMGHHFWMGHMATASDPLAHDEVTVQ